MSRLACGNAWFHVTLTISIPNIVFSISFHTQA